MVFTVSFSASGKIDLFITHGGAGSVMESATYGVPTVVVPLFGDQMRNARMLERFGSGLVYNKQKLSNEKMLTEAIQQGLYCPRYSTLSALREKIHFQAQRESKTGPENAKSSSLLPTGTANPLRGFGGRIRQFE